jgi:hypothetical protein
LFGRIIGDGKIMLGSECRMGGRCLDDRLMKVYVQPMKVANRPRAKKPRHDFQSQRFTLSGAKSYLGRLIEKVMKGETVYIVRGRHRFILQEVPEIEPIPLRVPGYFANCYTSEEIGSDNRLSKASVVRAPKDLE